MRHSVISVDVCTQLCHHSKRKSIATVGWADFEVRLLVSPHVWHLLGVILRGLSSPGYLYICVH